MNETQKSQVQTGRAQVISNPFPESTSHNIKSPPVAEHDQAKAQPDAANANSSTSPSAAADSDLIEKTWINAVDKISRDHGDDPFTLQQKQAELTRDYLKKRFGREIKAS